MAEIIVGFALGYGVPMFLLKRYLAHRRIHDQTKHAQTDVKRAA